MGHLRRYQRAHVKIGGFVRKRLAQPYRPAERLLVTIGGWSGDFWYATINDDPGGSRAAGLSDAQNWCQYWESSPDGMLFASDAAYRTASQASRKTLWGYGTDLAVAVLASDWTAAETARLAILAWTP